MINLMAYDFYYGAWAITAFNSPLYARNHPSFSRKHSVVSFRVEDVRYVTIYCLQNQGRLK